MKAGAAGRWVPWRSPAGTQRAMTRQAEAEIAAEKHSAVVLPARSPESARAPTRPVEQESGSSVPV